MVNRNEIEIGITQETKDILDKYDAEQLLNTIPNDYQLTESSLKLYDNKVKILPLPINISLSEETIARLTAISNNTNAPIALVFNFLIENVANCGKIQTKKVAHALDNYYKVALNHNDPILGELLSQILDGYANSGFYDAEEGLSEKGIADFLTLSDEGKQLVQEIDKLRG